MLTYNLQPTNQSNNTGSYSSLGVNIYTVTVTDAVGCTTSSTVNITEPNPVIWDSVLSVDVICNGGNDGSITVVASGGTSTFNYNLLPGNINNSTGVYNNLSIGNYTITGTDANNCSLSTVVNIGQPLPLSWSNTSSTMVSCNGGNDGTISVTVAGGTGTVSYNLQPGNIVSATGSFSNLSSGNYTITGTDANNCTATTIINVTEPTVLNITSVIGTDPSCVPGNDGSITVVASGGTAAYQYNIGGANQANNIFNNVGAGNYTITVTDANGCTATSTFVLIAPNAPIINSVNTTDVSCNGGSNGSMNINASGNAPLSYNILPQNQTNLTGNFSGLSAMNYTISVTDGAGCSASSIVQIAEPQILSWDTLQATDISCNGANDGSMLTTTLGGTPLISYNLQPNNINSTNGSFTNLAVGVYTIIATDANGCTATTMLSISEPPVLIINSASTTAPSCMPGMDGSITVLASGGTPAYQFNIGGANQANNIFNNVGAGNYTITVTDANGCTTTSTVSLSAPNAPIFSSATATNVNCNGGNDGAIASAANGSGILSYTLQPGNVVQNNGNYNNLSVGNYTIIASDAMGCTSSTTLNITEPTPVLITNVSTTSPTCIPGNDGSITITASGGTNPFVYNIGGANQANNVFNNIGTGNYTITVTDANGCSQTSAIIIQPLTAPTINNVSVQDISCNGDIDGALTINASSGNGTLSYNLQPSNITNATGIYTGLGINNYTVMVTDAAGCTATSLASITEPPVLNLTLQSSNDVLCNGTNTGNVSVAANGGTASYSYTLSPGAVVNSNGAFTNLGANNYTIVVTDANNCTNSLTINIAQPQALNLASTLSNVSCFGGNDGSIDITANGGVSPYSFNLMPTSVTNTIGQFNNLLAGNYSVYVTDSNNCVDSLTNLVINEPQKISFANVSVQDIDCNGDSAGAITIGAIGGSGNLTYAITPQMGTQSPVGQFNNLIAGQYQIQITDTNNCTADTTLQVNQNPRLTITSASFTEPKCFGDLDGSISVTATGGVGAIKYSIDNISFNTFSTYNNLGAGNYTIYMQDDKGCKTDTSLTLGEPDKVDADILIVRNISCVYSKDGSISVYGKGGNGGYSYLIRPGMEYNKIGYFGNLEVGSYTITVYDTNQCSFDTIVSINPPEVPLATSMTKKDVTCDSYGSNGAAEVIVTGGTQPYSYLWSTDPTQSSARVENIRFGLYNVMVVDAVGCIAHDTVYVNPGDCCGEVFAPNAFTPNGDGNNDQWRIITAAGIDLKKYAVYNRWGQRVWATKDYLAKWDGTHKGTPVEIGTYYYIFQYICLSDGQTYTKKGDINVIR